MVEIYDAHEQERVVKKWLAENGSAIVIGLAIAFGGLFGFRQWQSWQESNRQEASEQFAVMTELLSQQQLDAAMSNFEALREEHGKSPYTTLAALQMARARIEVGQSDLAVGLYEQAMEKGYPKALKVVARERLARILLDQGDPARALQIIQGADKIEGFEALYAEVRGDIYLSQGDEDSARTAYEEALAELEEGAGDRATLVMKLESLGASAPDGGA